MENKVKVWLAREANGVVFVHFEKPHKSTYRGFEEWISRGKKFFDKEFPSVKWEDDEPTEAYITLAEPQEHPQTAKQDIDWEQRRYELAKDLYLRYKEMDEKQAVRYADALINELKKQSDEL